MMSLNAADQSDDVVRPDQVTADFLYSLFHTAYFDVHRDEADDVYIQDGFITWAFPQEDGSQIRLMSQFNGKPDVPRSDKLEYVNKVNDQLRLIRAYVDADEDIGFDYYMSIEGGTTRRSIALTVRRFTDYVRAAVQQDSQDVIA
jgi:hypothetical protein